MAYKLLHIPTSRYVMTSDPTHYSCCYGLKGLWLSKSHNPIEITAGSLFDIEYILYGLLKIDIFHQHLCLDLNLYTNGKEWDETPIYLNKEEFEIVEVKDNEN